MKKPFEGQSGFLFTMPGYLKFLMASCILIFSWSIMGTIGLFTASGITGLSVSEISGQDFHTFGVRMVNAIKILVIFNDIGLFVLPAILIPYLLYHVNMYYFTGINKKSGAVLILFSICLVLAIQPMVDMSAFLNGKIVFPDFMAGIEKSLKMTDMKNRDLVNYLVAMPDMFSLVLNVLIVAVLPAIVEELFFRGLLQGFLIKWTQRAHLSIFISAIIFSMFHGEFYAFIPRFLLGLLLGYVFYWSQDLKLSMLIHFINNSLGLVVGYIKQHLDTKADILKQDNHSPIWLFILSTILFGIILYLYRRKALTSNPIITHESDKTES